MELIDVHLTGRRDPIRFRVAADAVTVVLDTLADPDGVLRLSRDGIQVTAIPVRTVSHIDHLAKRQS